MIEAVENHMPEVIVIDEIGTELEAAAARTIAERGVQLVATAHGNELENLMMNPTLADLIGGIQSVTLGDEEARRRGTQKSILERKAPPTFDIVVEIQSWERVAVHGDVAETVDAMLRGYQMPAEVRELGEDGEVRVIALPQPSMPAGSQRGATAARSASATAAVRGDSRGNGAARGRQLRPADAPFRRVYPFGISRKRLEQAVRETGARVAIADELSDADTVITLRTYFRRKPQALRDAEARGIPIYVLKTNTVVQMEQSLLSDAGTAGRRRAGRACRVRDAGDGGRDHERAQRRRAVGRSDAAERVHPPAAAPDGAALQPHVAQPGPRAVPPRAAVSRRSGRSLGERAVLGGSLIP